MSKGDKILRYVACCVLLFCLFTSASLADGTEPSVLVEVYEKIPPRSWEFSTTTPTTTFLVDSLGLVDIPLKYDDHGLRSDRSNPFLVRATCDVLLPAGEYRLLLRAKSAARLSINGQTVAETQFLKPNADGHENVAEPEEPIPGLCELPAGHQQCIVEFKADQDVHRVTVESIVGGKNLRAELGELFVATARPGEPFRLLTASPPDRVLDDPMWQTYSRRQRAAFQRINTRTRRTARANADEFWQHRHALARDIAAEWKPVVPDHPTYTNPIDRILAFQLKQPFDPITDIPFLRRVTLDTVGVIPTLDEIETFRGEPVSDRRLRVIDQLLVDDRWADHWVSYWQDLLAENPGLLKPKLNNTGPFRWWIHESLLDNLPLDRFATELIMMRGSKYGGGPAGFAMATENDVPMAAKAHIVAKAFLGVEMKCARCHDAPSHNVSQRDTFRFAAMLKRQELKVPESSTVPVDPDNHSLAIEINLKPGEAVAPGWPFAHLAPAELPEGILRDDNDWRERAAAIVTSPMNRRFAEVMVNRIWQRYLGWGIVDEVDDWENGVNRSPQLLEFLSHELTSNDYDLKHIARLILSSRFYQQPARDTSSSDVLDIPPVPRRRRMTAEQLLDSLASAMGKPLCSEQLCLDPEGRRPVSSFLNLGVPSRAWQMAPLSNERDRPALSLPVARGVADVLSAFGWRESRQDPTSIRDHSVNVLQPLVLSNGVTTTRLTGLSDDSFVTALALADLTLDEFVEALFQSILTRKPSNEESLVFTDVLAPGFEHRRLQALHTVNYERKERRFVSWANHLSPEATRIKLDLERAVLQGDPPTQRLASGWRERAEDVVWALVNSPEFVFIP